MADETPVHPDIAAILRQFEPTLDWHRATHRLTMDELIRLVEGMNGEDELRGAMLPQLMRSADFVTETLGDTSYWLMRSVL